MSFFSLLNLPNILTLINLFAGCVAVVFTFSYQIELVPYCVLISLVADFLDGFAARMTKKSTEAGKQLDSLADMVSFGVVPGAILFQLLFERYEADPTFYSMTKFYLFSLPAFLVTLFAALRLAKFNVDTRQTDGFFGLATPAATIFVVGYLLIILHNPFDLGSIIYSRKILYGVIAGLSLLMVTDLPMFSFKFKSFNWKGNEVIYLFIFLCVVLLTTLKFAAVSAIIILYILISIAQKLFKR